MDELIILGCSASMGVPTITCKCGICRSPSPFNKRLRPSALLKLNGKNFLIDAGPDLRAQMLRSEINDLDGLLITHTHFDHISGLDELRVFNALRKKGLACLLSEESLREISSRYPYLVSRFEWQLVEEGASSVSFLGEKMTLCSYIQTGMKVLGFRFGSLAYVLDLKEYKEEVVKALEGVDKLVLGALRHAPSEAHFTIDEAISFGNLVGAKEVILSHLGHEIDYETTSPLLPSHVKLAYDGMRIPL